MTKNHVVGGSNPLIGTVAVAEWFNATGCGPVFRRFESGRSPEKGRTSIRQNQQRIPKWSPVAGSFLYGYLAQLVERRVEASKVVSSILTVATQQTFHHPTKRVNTN